MATDAATLFSAAQRRIEDWHRRILAPGSGRVVRISKPVRDPESGMIVLSGQSVPALDAAPQSALYRLDSANGTLERLAPRPGDQLDPLFNPAGGRLLYREANPETGRYEACLLDTDGGTPTSLGTWSGSVEQAAWADDDTVALLIADPGVSMASIQGATRTEGAATDRPGWFPSIDDGLSLPRRRAAMFDLARGGANWLGNCNIWEICPAPGGTLIALASDDPREDAWYRADLRQLDAGGGEKIVYRPQAQVSAISVSPDGRFVAFAEGLASDRGSLAGDLMLLDLESRETVRLDTQATDISWTGWNGDTLVAAGICGNDMVILAGEKAGEMRILHRVPNCNGGPKYPELALIPFAGRLDALCVLVEPARSERLARMSDGPPDILWDSATSELREAAARYGAERFRPVAWTASDGLDIDGWLHLPEGDGPFPLAMLIHGGPTMRWVPKSLSECALQAALADAGFAQFMPNPRGSTGRGQAYARAILHDMGGRDMHDLLEGVDHLVATGIADPLRLYVSGISHGGFMTSWIVTQDARFRAGAAVSPITDWTSQRLTSDIPSFNDSYIGPAPGGLPSAILHADKVTAKMLMIAGAKDRCTPPAQAEEFHTAVRLEGGASTLIIYPGEGHGIRSLPAAAIDHLARIVTHFSYDAAEVAAGAAGAEPVPA
ncbi:MAG: prolyl oligopeptidase family serine peptidase [Sphingopyxis sp.]|nr:prolyl oligopeptidase family serine peptidase [Sphingopyxis sp.]